MTEEQVFRVLQGINASIPKRLRDSVVTKADKTPVLKMIMQKAIEDESVPQERRDEIRTLMENGHFDKQEYREDPAVAKKINEYTNRQINKAVKEGRLPSRKELIKLQSLWKEQKRTS